MFPVIVMPRDRFLGLSSFTCARLGGYQVPCISNMSPELEKALDRFNNGGAVLFADGEWSMS